MVIIFFSFLFLQNKIFKSTKILMIFLNFQFCDSEISIFLSEILKKEMLLMTDEKSK